MDALLSFLPLVLPQPLGCVVHVGAGAHALQGASVVPAERLVLIEGDAQACSELGRAAVPGCVVEVLNVIVAPRGGTATWHRHNLPSMNGLRNAEVLRDLYPRLRVLEARACETQAFGDTLARLGLERQPTRHHVLLMDVPGQEATLLDGVAPALLQAFEWIVLRSSRSRGAPDWDSAEATTPVLQAASFAAVTSVETDPAWPVALWRFDRHEHERRQLRRALEQAHAAHAHSEHAREQLQTLVRGEGARAEGLALELQDFKALSARFEEQCKQLQAAHGSLVEQLAATRSEAAATAERLSQAERVLAQREAELASSTEQAKRHERASAEALSAKAALERELKALKGDLEEARAGLVSSTRDAAAREARLQDELSQLTLRQRLLDEEMIKAEGQLELIKDVLLREPSL